MRDSQADWPRRYNQRAGIKGTLSQGVRAFGLRRSRYVGLVKTHLQHVFIATAMNLSRIVNWLNEVPLTPDASGRLRTVNSAGNDLKPIRQQYSLRKKNPNQPWLYRLQLT